MAGQPQAPGILEFDVTSLEVTAEPGIVPLNIVEAGEDFTLTATFGATPGMWWNNLKDDHEPFTVEFYAEGLGVAAGDIDLGTEPGNLDPADDTYPVNHVVVGGIAQPGVYKMACVVTLDDVPGVVGYYDELVVQVYSP